MAAHLLVERDAPVRASLHPYAGAEEVEDGQIRVHVCKFVFTANTCASPTHSGSSRRGAWPGSRGVGHSRARVAG